MGYNGKHRADEPKSFGTGQRKNSSPNGWADGRIETDSDPNATHVHGFRPGGPEGPHPVKK